MNDEFNPEQYAILIAKEYKKIDPDLITSFYFPDPENKQVRLLMVNPKTSEDVPLYPCGFPILNQDQILAICDITPREWEQVKKGTRTLTVGWVWESCQEIPL